MITFIIISSDINLITCHLLYIYNILKTINNIILVQKRIAFPCNKQLYFTEYKSIFTLNINKKSEDRGMSNAYLKDMKNLYFQKHFFDWNRGI